MRKIIASAALAAFAFSSVAAGAQTQAAPEGYQFEAELAKGDAVTFQGQEDTGGFSTNGLISNVDLLELSGIGFDPEACGDTYEEKCDKAFLDVTAKGSLDVLFTPGYGGDFDLYLYEIEDDGSIGAEVASSAAGWAPVADPIGIAGPTEQFTAAVPAGDYALVVFYFAAGGGYDLDVSLA